ncbi:hypothetical protein GCM10022276_14160 [Sphingomonas limnosediminicola]|uniref:Uncharacterized protein n=1 Tax=Sphingomonas limnosediminicola TaxID=940133 RepID=A0ABP7L9V5_9SPHN
MEGVADAAHLRDLSALYGQVAEFDALEKEEAKAAASLTPLGFDRRLDGSSRTQMLASLAEVDRINSLMALNATRHWLSRITSMSAFHPKLPLGQACAD